MIHPDTRLVIIDGVVGSGVIATKRIPRGTITWVLDDLDRTFNGAQMNAMPASYDDLIDRWTFHDGRGWRVLCWDLGRYMNHSCEPNCGGSEFWFEVALRDIEAGEQLTNDYATLYMRPSEGFDCRCGAPTLPVRVRSASSRRRCSRHAQVTFAHPAICMWCWRARPATAWPHSWACAGFGKAPACRRRSACW